MLFTNYVWDGSVWLDRAKNHQQKAGFQTRQETNNADSSKNGESSDLTGVHLLSANSGSCQILVV